MKQVITSFVVATLLTGCATLQTNSESAATTLKDNVHNTAERVEGWLMTPPEKKPKQAVPTSYCYQSFQDILCYRQPMPGWESRLVGYQGTGAKPPQVAVMKALPTRATGVDMSPEMRAENAKPLVHKNTQEAKPAEEEVASGEVKTITIDAAHESLPDPTLAPQL